MQEELEEKVDRLAAEVRGLKALLDALIADLGKRSSMLLAKAERERADAKERQRETYKGLVESDETILANMRAYKKDYNIKETFMIPGEEAMIRQLAEHKRMLELAEAAA